MFKYIIACISLIMLPNKLKIIVLNLLGHSVDKTSRLGLFFIKKNTKLSIGPNSRVSSFNFFLVNSICLEEDVWIKEANFFKGNIIASFKSGARVGKLNQFSRGDDKEAEFQLGNSSVITTKHYFDLSDSIKIGSNVVVGGRESQFWTHSFRHESRGEVRNRVLGSIKVGDGCYLGSRCILLHSTNLMPEVTVGAGTTVNKILSGPSTYVSARNRKL